MARNVHRLGEAFGGAVEKPALKFGLGCEGDRMDENVQPAPSCANLFKGGLQLPRDGNIDLACDRRFKLSGERFDEAPRFLVQPRHGEVSADGAERLGAPVGDGILVGDAYDERLLSSQHWAQLHVVRHRAPFSEWAKPPPSAAPPPP